ncbi:probable murein peptide carboxypeptidase [Folsomia candida]|uniref:Putative murein peptide carboxypeptidase n=1 Tax=Folsomia candida TaxID=158441 RepID=A0A226F6T9_FOLCA|nr:probable murein peptide carboxypeptidase [Folsomia candida]OXA65050.1 putative murein peptide carboxypeptidase [Folsomia candida]
MYLFFIFLGSLAMIGTGIGGVSTNRVGRRAQAGDICRIVAPLSPGLPQLLNETVQVVTDLGFTAQISNDIYDIIGPDDGEQWYSNTDEFRARDLADAILDPQVKIIWLINGGSGAFRTIEGLERMLPPAPLPSKPIIGFSAVTPIFAYLQQKYDWPTIHGAVLDLIVQNYYENSTEISVDPLIDLMYGNITNTTVPFLTRIDNGTVLDEPLISTVVGGSFRQIALTIGTPYKLNTTGRILFLEMFEQDPNSVQDFFDALLFSGTFDNVSAIVFGDFMADMFHPPHKIQWILEKFANENPRVTAPVFRLFGIGHTNTNHPLPFNTKAVLRNVIGDTYMLTVDNVY